MNMLGDTRMEINQKKLQVKSALNDFEYLLAPNYWVLKLIN